jgi:phytepsin
LDGRKLPKSALVPSKISNSALVSTGSPFVSGPPDLIKLINNTIGGSFDCTSNHTLTFQIGGKIFPIDARDFAIQAASGSPNKCVASIEAMKVPKGDGSIFLYSWNLGNTFLRSVLTSFYMGNLTHPSNDPPRIGFLSTVPDDDGAQLKAAVSAAGASDLPETWEPAPTGTPARATKTNSVGVLQAPTQGTSSSSSGGRGSKNAATSLVGSLLLVVTVVVGVVIV